MYGKNDEVTDHQIDDEGIGDVTKLSTSQEEVKQASIGTANDEDEDGLDDNGDYAEGMRMR